MIAVKVAVSPPLICALITQTVLCSQKEKISFIGTWYFPKILEQKGQSNQYGDSLRATNKSEDLLRYS